MRLSVTGLITFRSCPRAYRYAYIERLPTVSTPALRFGRAIHETLATLHRLQMETGAFPDLASVLDTFEDYWREATEEAETPSNADAPEDYPVLADDLLTAYVTAEADRPSPIAIEFPFELPFQIAGEEIRLCGVIDRLDEHEGRLVVVEYKTGKRKPSLKALSDDLQLTCYAYAAAETFGLPTVTLAYRHLRSNAILMTHREPRDFQTLTEDILPSVVTAIREDRFPPRYGWRCRFCDFAALCQAEGPEASFLPDLPAALAAP